MLSSFKRFKHKAPADGNAAAAYVGYAFTETSFGYPITPSTPAFELVESWAHADKRKNCMGVVPTVVMMEHEGGVAGAIHGASVTGTLSSTYTSSQGLLLMLPNLFKIRYAKVPSVFHVPSRAIINSMGTIECDHSDVMSVRTSGVAMLSSSSNQDCHDLGAVAHTAAIKGMVPFVHFYDGFRTSHQITNVEFLEYSDYKTLIDFDKVKEFRERAFNPNHPSFRMMAIDSAFHFQMDVAASYEHSKLPDIVQESMDKVGKLTGRPMKLFDYYGHPEAESVIIVMGSTAQNIQEAVDYLNGQGKKYGVITVRLYRPFSTKHLLQAIPKTCKVITALDRVREPGANSQPLHSDVCTALYSSGWNKKILGGTYGIGGRELTPSQASAIFENSLKENPKNFFTAGIVDDLMKSSLPLPEEIDMVPEGTKQCIFWGLGSDGTIGANKEAISIICDETPLYGQAYFTYDAKKSGGITRSHLRFGKSPIRANYAIKNADYIAIHSPRFPSMYPVCNELKKGGTFVLNCSASNAKEAERFIPTHIRRQLFDKKAQVYIVDATKISIESGIPGRINLIMQAVFFQLSNVLDINLAIKLLKKSVQKSYGHQGEKVVNSNINAIDRALSGIIKLDIPNEWGEYSPVGKSRFADAVATEKMKKSIFPIFEMKGNEMKSSDFVDVYSYLSQDYMGSSKYEKRGIATHLPIWNSDKCIQCNSCSVGCAHSAIRPVIFKGNDNSGLKTIKSKQFKGYDFRIDVSPYDCLGCGVCIQRCPVKALTFVPSEDKLFKELEEDHLKAFSHDDIDQLAEKDAALKKKLDDRKFTVDGSQYLKPLLEYSGACGGCHETLYAKMLTQLFGPRLMIANATGCSIVWSGSFPSIPWTTNYRGQGPTWGNSLFEDNAEYGLGIYTSIAHRREELKNLVMEAIKRPDISSDLKKSFELWLGDYLNGDKSIDHSNVINDQLRSLPSNVPEWLKEIRERRDLFIKPSVWLVGGDGWANDIGFAGVDHVLASGADVNFLIYDNESYANTGFQMSKATPRGAVMKFAATGKDKPKKELTQMMMQYPHIYVANCCISANPQQTIKAMKEADSYLGSSLIDAYCPCLGMGIKPGLQNGHHQAKLAVESGYWPLFRRDPRAEKKFVLDSKVHKPNELGEMLKHEVRYESLRRLDPKRLETLQELLAQDIETRWEGLKKLDEKA